MTLIQDRSEEYHPEPLPELTEIVPGPRPRGLLKYVTSTDHKQIGINYMVTAFIGFLLDTVVSLRLGGVGRALRLWRAGTGRPERLPRVGIDHLRAGAALR